MFPLCNQIWEDCKTLLQTDSILMDFTSIRNLNYKCNMLCEIIFKNQT